MVIRLKKAFTGKEGELLNAHDEMYDELENDENYEDDDSLLEEEPKTKVELFLNALLLLSVIFAIICVILIAFIGDKYFIEGEILVRLIAFFIVLSLGIASFKYFLACKGRLKSIFMLLATALLFGTSWYCGIDAIAVYNDREAYQNGEFEIITAIPLQVGFESSDSTRHVSDLIFDNDLTIDVLHLWIPKRTYETDYEGKSLEVRYLKNSKLAISINIKE